DKKTAASSKEQPVKKTDGLDKKQADASSEPKKAPKSIRKEEKKPENTSEKPGLLEKLKLIRQKSEKTEDEKTQKQDVSDKLSQTVIPDKPALRTPKKTTPPPSSKLDELIAAKKKSIKVAATAARQDLPAAEKTSTRGIPAVPEKTQIKNTGAKVLARIEEILNTIDQRPSVRIAGKPFAVPGVKSEKPSEDNKQPEIPAKSVDPVKTTQKTDQRELKDSDTQKATKAAASVKEKKGTGTKSEKPESKAARGTRNEAEETAKLEELLKDKLKAKSDKAVSDEAAAKPAAAKQIPEDKSPKPSKTEKPAPSSAASSEEKEPKADIKEDTGLTPGVSIATSSGRMRLSRIEKGKTEASEAVKKDGTGILTRDESPVPKVGISPGKPDALLKNTSLKKGEIAPIVVKPTAFDEELFKTIPPLEIKQKGGYFLSSLKNKLNEATHKISLHQDNNQLWLLQIKEDGKGTEIQDFKEYTLPFHKGKLTLDSMDNLIDYVLKNDIDDSVRNICYTAYLSARHPTKTHIFQTPRLKTGDLNDLVAWHAKKNLPFSSDHAVINWEQIKSPEKSLKDDIVISAGDRSVIEKSIAVFEKHNLKLRFYSTIPVIMWKTFIQNYPDLNQGCYVLVRMGEMRTVVTVINSHKLAFSREIAIGADDLYKAVMKKVTADDKSLQIDLPLARQLLKKYGFPKDRTGISENSHIDLYKISIFLRPVVERITSELNRSLNYFKKQNPDLNWEAILFDGIASTFPNLVQTISESLNLKVGYFNPLRAGKYRFNGGKVIAESQLPNFVTNFALLAKNTEPLNIIPEKKRNEYGYIFRSKLMTAAAAVLLPLFAVSGFWMSTHYDAVSVKLDEKQRLAGQLLNRKNEMLILQKDTKLIEDYYHLLENDRVYSRYQMNLLKLLSNIIPKDIKLTSLSFTKETNETVDDNGVKTVNSVDDVLLLNGFVTSDVSLAHIQLTNFRLKLEQLPYFSSVSIDMEDIAEKASNKFLFNLKLGI
ncbi:MAG: pilus assembly protein PilM, partial [FCB group bacterium]|nr:pilus assembly protein PilM [FCB group bacterium]